MDSKKKKKKRPRKHKYAQTGQIRMHSISGHFPCVVTVTVMKNGNKNHISVIYSPLLILLSFCLTLWTLCLKVFLTANDNLSAPMLHPAGGSPSARSLGQKLPECRLARRGQRKPKGTGAAETKQEQKRSSGRGGSNEWGVVPSYRQE